MTSTQNPKSTQQQFVTDVEKRDENRLIGLNDETSSRKDDGSKGKANALRNTILSKSRGKNTLISPYGAHKGIGPDETIEGGYDQLDKLQNWGEFQNLLDEIKERKAQHRVEARQARAKHYVEPSTYASYPAEAMENLAESVGLKNRGIKYTPDLNSANTDQIWLNKKKAMAQSDAALEELNKYRIEEADLDNNPDTRDNVIVYSDRELGKIYSIDGYQLTSGQKKVNQRNIYSAFPVKEVRSDVMNSALKTDLKAWLRKYPTPQQQRKHPFTEFERQKSAFEILKNEIKDFLAEYNISMHTKTNQQGNLSVSHYMTFFQKLTSALNRDIMISYFRLPENYDFNIDEQSVKKASSQKQYKAWLTQETGEAGRVRQLVLNDTYRLVNQDIPDIFEYVNSTTGTYKPIAYELTNGLQKDHKVFNIVDKDVEKQQRLKQIRDANKNKRAGVY
jgi:hypothetical protein